MRTGGRNDWQRIGEIYIVRNMKEEGYRGRTVTVKVRFADFKTHTRAKTLDQFTDSEPEIRRAAFDCLGRFELKKKVRLIGVRVSNLEKTETGVKREGDSHGAPT